MKHALFITGTDTDVGKTIVTATLLRALRARGINAASMKPAQTGATRIDGIWRSPDLDLHHQAANLHVDDATYGLMVPYCYEPACSPHLAGRLVDTYPDIPQIIECAERLLQAYEVLLIEGAGGLMAPLDEDLVMLNLIVALDVPALVVARTGLGTINHSLLTLAELAAAQVPVAGLVFTQTTPVHDAVLENENPRCVSRLSNTPVLGILSHQPDELPDWDRFAHELSGLDAIVDLLR